LDEEPGEAYIRLRVRAIRLRPFAMSTALKQMTVDEFLSWAEGREGRWELHDGAPVMMAPERAVHGRVKFSAAIGLRDAVLAAHLPCEVFTDGMAIRINAQATYEPDASVVCGPQAPPMPSRSTIPSSWSKSCLRARRRSIMAAS
jgi:Uma2 family endonuclease